MICYSKINGDLTPIKFRYADSNQAWTNIKIDKILKKDCENLAGNKMLVFTCQSLQNNVNILYELKYEIESCRWILFKI